ncbi:hypothetical protein VCHA54P489_100119 [Vibrio chagasii]|nr:hypothetical protein VCHA54P489_100119 [Vibrio chagasii]CAH6903060.1 hypothetical protein VCHA49P380_100043 [Vibrio chagasii]CAH7256550.1 hypothetical protein VCHA54P496_370012 [Vibrio chagasii]CAH7275398.1 hypothetical protein VCHA53O468_50009 [Vibrio chagasii]CAH7426661.1 hypothetical protein VCHA37P202_80122 [Vibrio chagasii]
MLVKSLSLKSIGSDTAKEKVSPYTFLSFLLNNGDISIKIIFKFN